MALEAVVYPQDPLAYISCKDSMFYDPYNQQNLDQNTENNVKFGQEESFLDEEELQWRECFHQYPLLNPSLEEGLGQGSSPGPVFDDRENHPPVQPRRKRRRTTRRSGKNKEEIENQRMTHITVERNRRKQMNEYLAVLRSLMPSSYSQRGDQASIIGGTIKYVKELEHILQSMEFKTKTYPTTSPFSDIFTKSLVDESSSTAEIDVRVVENYANIKIATKKKPKQLLKLISSIESLKLTLLHLNVTTLNYLDVLYSINVKVEEGSQVNTVEEIATALNQIMRRIEEESSLIY